MFLCEDILKWVYYPKENTFAQVDIFVFLIFNIFQLSIPSSIIPIKFYASF